MKTAPINFLNRSQFHGPISLAFFDAPEHYDRRTLLLPWYQILNCPTGHAHPFVYSFFLQAQLIDPEEKKTLPFLVKPGWLYRITRVQGDETLEPLEPTKSGEISLLHDLPRGSRTILLSRSENPAAVRPFLAPGDIFSFRDSPQVIIRRISKSGTTEPLRKNEKHHRLALDGIRAANLLLTGGGAGQKAHACRFTLEKNFELLHRYGYRK
jgi:hypothetical protein